MERETSFPSIEKRPSAADRRKEVGHWEDDTMVSRESVARLKTITERVSGIHLIARANDGTAVEATRLLIERLTQLPGTVRKTLTRDRGTEHHEGARWLEVEKELNLDACFAHPYASYERGTNENSNGLMRRYIPKKSEPVYQ